MSKECPNAAMIATARGRIIDASLAALEAFALTVNELSGLSEEVVTVAEAAEALKAAQERLDSWILKNARARGFSPTLDDAISDAILPKP